MNDPVLSDITDALARGRLTLAELLQLTAAELDALTDCAVRRMSVGMLADAVTLFRSRVTLEPYCARAWRGLGVALHRQADYPQARAAYEAALLLAPEHHQTGGYLGEVLWHIGERVLAQQRLSTVAAQSSDAAAAHRAAEVLLLLQAAEPAVQAALPPRQAAEPVADADHMLEDGFGAPLPNPAGRFAQAASSPAELSLAEVTDGCFVILATETTATDTAIVAPRSAKHTKGQTREITLTAKVARPAAPPQGGAAAVLRRRAGLPWLDADVTQVFPVKGGSL